jgi:hypothetical protein
MRPPAEIHSIQPTVSSSQCTDFSSEKEFWAAFIQDLKSCGFSLTIVSPFITNDATWKLFSQLKELRTKGVAIRVFTRPREEHQNRYGFNLAYARLQKLGVEVKTVGKIHQKLAIIDAFICFEGSVNILGFNDSKEHMRRFQGTGAKELLGQFNLE